VSDGSPPTRLCTRCRLVKPLEDFSPSRRGEPTANRARGVVVCRLCSSADVMARYESKRDYVNALKLSLGCADCGYNARAIALTFDHLPGFEKVAKVSDLLGSAPLSVILEEISKCECVCANCHAIRTEDRQQTRGWWDRWRAENPNGTVPFEDPQLSFDF
jgi:hypothetical protein